MKNHRARFCGVAALIATLAISTHSAMSQGNSVVVESEHVAPGQTDVSIGVYISNTVALTAIALPLEFRTVGANNIPHTFTLGPVTFDWNPVGRCYSSVFGPNSPTGIPGQVITRYYWVRGGIECSGPTSGTYEVAGGLHDDHSPDGNLFTAIAVGCDNCGDDIDLNPGMETPGADAPSLLIQFDVNNVQGQFEIDTCCMRPATHLNFIDRNSSLVPDVAFTKGIITVGTPPENSVVVESKEVAPGTDSVFVGVWISNATELSILTIPLEFRSLGPGTFTTGYVERGFNPAGRLYHTPIGPMPNNSGTPPWITQNYYPVPAANSCSGPLSNSYTAADANSDDTSPDGYVLVSVVPGDISHDPCAARPGEEIQSVNPPSYYFRFNVTEVAGDFEIDTCCIGPGYHLSFIDCLGNITVPGFTKGIISIGCFCRCHGDPDCNGYLDIVDVVRTVNTAFRGLASITDQDCTHARTDVDANAMTNVLDVARMIDVVFGGELQDDVFVKPCAN